MKDNFIIHLSFYDAVMTLTDEQAGHLFKALMEYAKSDTITKFNDPVVSFAFRAMSSQISASNKKYHDKCEQNRRNILKRYTNVDKDNDGNNEVPSNTPATNEYERIQPNTNVYESYDRIPIDREIDKIDKIDKIDRKDRENNIAEDKSSVSSWDDSSCVMNYWNNSVKAHGSAIRPLKVMSDKRRAAVRARLHECKRDITQIYRMIDNAMTSAFLNGKNKDSKIFTFDQLFTPSMFGKTLEGNFNDAPAQPSQTAQLIEESKVVVDKEANARERYMQMIAIYKNNPKSMAVAPLMDAYRNGVLKSLGIYFTP